MTRCVVPAVLFAIGLATTGAAQTANEWGEAVNGAQLRLAVSDGPSPPSAALLSLEVQLRNQGAGPISFVGEAIAHPEIEIDGVWYAQVWAGSCCASPRDIASGKKGELFSVRIVPRQTFALGAIPALAPDLKPGQHWIRIRSASQDRIYIKQGTNNLSLTSNTVVIDIPARAPAGTAATAPSCDAGPGRRSDRIPGAIERGDSFSRTVGGRWVVRLEPIEFGWELRISTVDRPAADLSRLTPPWHAVPNPRDIEGWHFRDLFNTDRNDGSVNAPGAVREFIFSPQVGREIEYSGSATSTADVEKVRSFGRGWLFIDSYRLTPVEPGARASFESLTFWACVTWPAN